MDTPVTSNTGNYLAIAGLISSIASHFGYTVTTNDVLAIIGTFLIIVGLYQQYKDHKKAVQVALSTPVNTI